jgi:alkylation response protein AidB-like acyl-CoA dehydrogenase
MSTAATSTSTNIDELVDQLLADKPPATTKAQEFLGEQYDRGLAWVHFPTDCGGLGLTPRDQQRAQSRLNQGGAPVAGMRNPIGYGMCAPTIVSHGTPEQKARYLRPLFTSEEIWCQLFSEPGQGSDVAGLSSRAIKDGDEWVLNGQKVWTTLAHISKYGLLLARTNPDVPKHKGMTAFLIDMEAEGVEVRPLFQITGEAEFNEIFFTDVHLPDSCRIGAEGDGWRVAVTTLMNERVSIGGVITRRGGGPISEAMKIWKSKWAGDTSAHALALKDRLMSSYIRSEVLSMTNMRASQVRASGTPGPEGSVGKLMSAEDNKQIYDLCMDLLGNEGMLMPAGYPMIRPDLVGMGSPDLNKMFLRVRANSIEGGTSEVMRNILGERVLGLPGDVRSDKELPWKDIPRN